MNKVPWLCIKKKLLRTGTQPILSKWFLTPHNITKIMNVPFGGPNDARENIINIVGAVI